MRIVIEKTPVVCLTCEDESGSKRYHIDQLFRNLHIDGSFMTPILGIQKNKSGASGFFRMIEHGLSLQKPNEPFRPFLMIEDDVSFSEIGEVEVPDHADIVYVGLSKCSMNSYMYHYANYYESVDHYPDVVRIKHMLASHGILVCSALGAAVLQRSMLEVYLSDKPWDIIMAFIQPFYNVYALRKPWVYQDQLYGGDEACTRITLEGPDHPLPEEWINKESVSIKLL